MPFWYGLGYGVLTTPLFLFVVVMSVYVIFKCGKSQEVIIMAGILFVVTFVKIPYGYYEIPLCLFPILAAYELVKKIKLPERIKVISFLPYVVVLTLGVFAYFVSPNTYLLSYEKQELPQYQVAEYVGEEEVLCITLLDPGFYAVIGRVPEERYLCVYNTGQEESLVGLVESARAERYRFLVTDGTCDFVMEGLEGYCPVAEWYFEREGAVNYEETYKLYELREGGKTVGNEG